MQGRIEAAAEQATWVEALEEQMQRIDGQIEKAERQLESDAERLGMDEDERLALLDGDTSELPDLSKQSLSALAGPAKRVKQQLFILKQARSEAQDHKRRLDKHSQELRETLERARASDLQQAIRSETNTIQALRNRMQLGEHLEKLKRHYRDLENETVELTTSEALPIDRLILLSVPFIGGGISLIFGLANVFGVEWLVGDPDPTSGMLWILFGTMAMLTYYFGRENGLRTTVLDREDCERQIDTLRRQIREVESERNDIDSTLPTSGESLELRLRESEHLLADLEASLPTYHNQEAASQSYNAAKRRATNAAQALKESRREWAETLEELGLSESLSPSSVRSLSIGYETLQASRRRLEELKAEKEQRRRERQTIAKRIEMLYTEALEIHEEAAREADEEHEISEESLNKRFRKRTGPLEQLNHLHEELSRQQHWIKRRRELKEQDNQLKKQQSAHFRSIERGEQQRRALWAKCGVATPEQFYAMVDKKSTLAELRKQHADLDKQVRSIIGSHVAYEDVEREIEGATAGDLEKRWESLTNRMTETEQRVASLRTGQGELAQEMKHLGDDSRLSVAQLELGCVERKIEAASRRWQTLSMASCLLEDVCGTFERERQPETLREASSFLSQLTDGKYVRIWTPLGTNQLKIDDNDENSLPLDVLSRGTREAVFIALRLSLAAAYARRGVMLPLVLDDVLVNFDGDRAMHAAQTLKTFAELGHQVLMFTCHDHIVDIFHEIGVEVREMPAQGEPGRATVLLPDFEEEEEYEEEPEEEIVEEVMEEEEIVEEPVIEEPVVEAEPEPEPEPVVVVERPKPKPKVVYVERPKPMPKKRRRPQIQYFKSAGPLFQKPTETNEPKIGWAWYEREPVERLEQVEGAIASITQNDWLDNAASDLIPDEVLGNDQSWWNGSSAAG